MNSPLRVGVVGVGYLGNIHAGIYARMPGVHLAGVADIEPQTATQVGNRYACPHHTDPYALIDDVDAVSIVVPTSAHFEVALPYLEAGKHMLMEKPVAPTVEAAEKLVAKADEAGLIFLVGHLERFNAGIMALAERVGEARFIEVHRLGTFVGRATDVDVVTDLMIHDIDIVLSLIKSELKDVSAVGSPVLTRHVDIANARLEFNNGAVANVTASRVSAKTFRRIRVFSNNGYHALNFIDQQIDSVHKAAPDPARNYPDLVSDRLEVTPKAPLDAELEHFVSIIENKRQPFVNGQDGIRALRVAQLVQDRIAECLT